LIGLLGSALLAVPYVLREPGPSVGADAAATQTSESEQGEGENRRERERLDLLDDQERHVAESIGRARESAVTLEYAAAEGPSEARRVATGVVISDAGEVLSIRIDPPPSTSPVVARNAAGRRHAAEWLAGDAETGLTLLRIKPGFARSIRGWVPRCS
jgi:serine protease Do